MKMEIDAERFRAARADAHDGTQADQRAGKRHASVLLIGKVRHGETDAACLVHDISKNGLMARFTIRPAVGDRVGIEVRGLSEIRATVRWVDGFRAGVEFATPQVIERVFCIRDDDGTIARTPRFALAAPVALRLGDRPMSAEIVDISPGGVKLQADFPVEPGQAGRIVLPETGASVYGTVCWVRDNRFGFRFATPLPLATLAQVLSG